MEKTNTKDALGNEIVMGQKYGYSATISGVTSVKIGYALHFTKTGLLTIHVQVHKTAMYNREMEEEGAGVMISVKPG